MRLKESVKLQGIRPELLICIMVVESIYNNYDVELVITSVMDGQHKRSSAHNTGRGVDVRTRNIPNDDIKQKIINDIRASLTDEFDLVIHSTHFHLEFDPK